MSKKSPHQKSWIKISLSSMKFPKIWIGFDHWMCPKLHGKSYVMLLHQWLRCSFGYFQCNDLNHFTFAENLQFFKTKHSARHQEPSYSSGSRDLLCWLKRVGHHLFGFTQNWQVHSVKMANSFALIAMFKIQTHRQINQNIFKGTS